MAIDGRPSQRQARTNLLNEIPLILSIVSKCESDLTGDEVWRDLETLEVVTTHLKLDPDFRSNVHDFKANQRAREPQARYWPTEEELRQRIAQVVARQPVRDVKVQDGSGSFFCRANLSGYIR